LHFSFCSCKRPACGKITFNIFLKKTAFLSNERNYKFPNPEGIYFISFATVFWIDVFTRRLYFDCIVEDLNHCVDNKGMEIYAWCIMPSHIHLVFRSTVQRPEELIRDFKSYTSKQLIALIANNAQESRREWLLNSFKKAAVINSNNTKNQILAAA